VTWQLIVAGAALLTVVLMIVSEVVAQFVRRPRKRVAQRYARRQPLLEDRMREALEQPRAQYGEIFTNYAVWRKENETRMELFAGAPWQNLNAFTRALVVRHIWRALERLAKGSVVVVDAPPQEWSAQVDDAFDDQGIDPWGGHPAADGTAAGGPQFVKGA
jgi:hypothetical protein